MTHPIPCPELPIDQSASRPGARRFTPAALLLCVLMIAAAPAALAHQPLLKPVDGGPGGEHRPEIPMARLTAEIAVKDRHMPALFRIPGVVGAGIGEREGRPVIVVLVDASRQTPELPAALDGVPVVAEPVGRIELLNGGCSLSSPCHNQELPLPVEMGNATSSADTCDSGTLGFKACHSDSLTVGYVSANHVAAGTPGASTHCFNGPVGMAQMHPGNYEIPGCQSDPTPPFTNYIGSLHSFVPVVGGPGRNRVDAAFVASSALYTSPSIRDIGTPSKTPGTPALNQCVRKSGRTTGLSTGRIDLVSVTWTNLWDDCFTNDPIFDQSIRIVPATSGTCANPASSEFALSGDSGSAVVAGNRIVGLVFARNPGSGAPVFASSISNVLNSLRLTLDLDQCTPMVTLNPVADAWIQQEDTDRNRGSDTILRIRDTDSGWGRYAFLKFNVPGHGGRLVRATLRMRVESTVQRAGIFRVFYMTWTESGVTWDNWLASHPTWQWLGDYSNLATGSWVDFDVTGQVSPGENTFGLASPIDAGQQDFYSRESAYQPSLILEYAPMI